MPKPTYTHTLDAAAMGDALLRHEWLLTNGTGTFAAGTALGANTRRYHGLLIAATAPPVGRVALLNQCFEQLVLTANDGHTPAPGRVEQIIELSSLVFRDGDQEMLVPDGHRRLTGFDKGTSVRWTYRWGPVQVTRELFLHWKQPTATLRYTVKGLSKLPDGACDAATLRISPMMTLRDFHATLKQHEAGHVEVNQLPAKAGAAVRVTRHGLHAALGCSAGTFIAANDWWHNVHYPIDRRRGQDDCEDYFVPGRFDIPLDAAGTSQITLTVTLGQTHAAPISDDKARLKHLRPIIKRLNTLAAPNDSALPLIFAQASDDFVVDRRVKDKTLSTILAGYPWFADWGRDTFIALPGLLLSTGRFDEARATLRAFAQAIGTGEHEGLVPNRFDDYDDNAAHYNTVDASLWFIHAALSYVEASGDRGSWKDWLAAACVRIVEAYARGTGFGIHMDHDGLIAAGDWNTQLTWMDAAAVPPGSDQLHVFTPRQGKAVEINALWYHALMGLSQSLPGKLSEPAARFKTLAVKAKRSFAEVFWNDAAGCLYDHVYVTPGGGVVRDASLRPNQCLAVSLPHSPLAPAKQKAVMKAVGEHLLTPAGLQTIPADDENFHPWYAGPQFERDKAYHQGTIWPWMIGPYAEGLLRAGRFSAASRRAAGAAIEPLIDFLRERGLGQLYEIHQAHPVNGSHPPRGCFAQAWSVAEVLRVWALLQSPPAAARK